LLQTTHPHDPVPHFSGTTTRANELRDLIGYIYSPELTEMLRECHSLNLPMELRGGIASETLGGTDHCVVSKH
jgi:hypothetical protein